MSKPIKVQELFRLGSCGISESDILFDKCTMQSDTFICALNQVGDRKQMNIIRLENPERPLRLKISADSAIMHPTSLIVAVRAGSVLQIFDIQRESKKKDATMNEEVVFWRWINTSMLAIVTVMSVYHWQLEGDSNPIKIFDKENRLKESSIINYTTDKQQNWLVLIGIAAENTGAPGQTKVVGRMQLYSVEKGVSQIVEGHAATFVNFKFESNPSPFVVLSFAVRGSQGDKIYFTDLATSERNSVRFDKKCSPFYFSADFPADFPVSMQASDELGVVYAVTKYGFVHVYEVETGTCLYRTRVSEEPIFCTAPHLSTNGIVGVNKKGRVLVVCLDLEAVVPYMQHELGDTRLAAHFAIRNNLSGANELFSQRFEELFNARQYPEAALVAAQAPKGVLRTAETLQRFRNCPAPSGQPSPLLQYFGVLLERGHLNRLESIELVRPALQAGRQNLVERWLKEEKLECSEELANEIKGYYPLLALSVYLRAECHEKAIQCFAETGQFKKIILYAKKVNFTPDYSTVFRQVMLANPKEAKEFADMLLAEKEPIDYNAIANVFLEFNDLRGFTAFLLEALKDDREEDAALQTKLLEVNLTGAPQVADAIIANGMFSKYDRSYIAQLCENAGLYQRALELYSDVFDIKRALTHSDGLNDEWLVNYFGRLNVEDSLECLRALLSANPRQNLRKCVLIACKYHEAIGAASLIELFEGENCYEGLFHYLRSVVDSSDDADVHYKYIQAAVKLGQNKEIERICRKSTCYDAERVKNFLKDANLPDQLPLIIVCDRHGFVHDLVMHLYRHNLTHYIEIYVQKVNTSRLPTVVGALLDVDCSEDFIKNLISSVPSSFDIAELTNEIEKRNKLRLILPWLESKVSQGSQDPGIHTALAKIYIDSNQNAERFLTENHYYDPLLVGRYSSKRDPHLAFIAFRRGRCDADILQLCQENAMFKNEARYLVSRRDLDLWAKVLDKSNPFRRQVIDQVVQTALPETQEAEDVLTTVKAFLTAALPDELLDLLEKLVLENTSLFGSNRSLQNLLLLTAIKADSCKVIDFINRCDNYDAPEIAREALESGLFEEAFTIYKKFDDAVAAMQVLINNIGDVERASEFANNCHQPEVYSLLAKAQLDKLLLTDAIHSYIAAGDPSNYKEVVDVAGRLGEYTELLKFLVMAKSKLREPFIEAELVYVLAKCERLSELEDFLSGPNVLAQLQNVGERCYNDGLYAASKIIFRSVSNYAFLALTSIRLGDLQTAVDCAKKAKSTKTWRDVCFACVEAKDFRLAQFCGQNLAVHTDELERLIHFYSSRGYFLELIDLLDSALGSDRAHMGMFTELAVLYAFHAPERLLSYLSMFWSRVNLPKVLRATERAHLWKELAFLYVKYADWDNAARLAMAHPTEAWKHSEFKEIISKVGASELYYKALQFYIDYAPTLLSELMNAILSKIDHVRAVKFFQKTESLALVKNYLVSVQDRNIEAVNEVIHTMYIDEENPDMLRLSTEKYDNFDKIALAKKLENHEQLEFRRIAAFLYKSAKRWDLALTLCKSDSLLSDAIEYTAELANPESAEDLLKYFIEQKNYVCYAACLYTCFHVLRPDVVLEYAWRHQLMDYTMPYLIQIMKNYGDKVHELSAFHQTKLAEERRAEKVPQPLLLDNDRLMITHGPVNGSGINVNDAAAGSFLSTGLPVKAWDAK